MALPGLSVFGLASMGANIAGSILQAEEFGNQVDFEKQVLENNSKMVLAARDSSIRDIETRKRIMQGNAMAVASGSGVRISGSVIDVVADIHAKAEVDKLRTRIQSDNQVALNRARSGELSRQVGMKKTGAVLDAFIGGSAVLAGGIR